MWYYRRYDQFDSLMERFPELLQDQWDRSWTRDFGQTHRQVNDTKLKEKFLNIIRLITRLKRALGVEEQTDSSQLEFKMKRKFFLVMGQKN